MDLNRSPNLLLPRRLLLSGGALGLATMAFPVVAALPTRDRLAFSVIREGMPIGSHSLAFRREGEDLRVRVDILLEIKFAFITVFRYQHRNEEVWRDGRLIALDTRTDDDGDNYWVKARATDEGLAVEGSKGTFLAPAETIPTSYWNPATVKQTELLDTQRGGLMTVKTVEAGKDRIETDAGSLSARRYDMSGDLNLKLWYAGDGEWVKIAFTARGSEVEYVRQQSPASLNTVQTG